MWASVVRKLQLSGFASLSQNTAAVRPLEAWLVIATPPRAGRIVEGRGKPGIPGGRRGQSGENQPGLKQAGSEDLIRNYGEGLLLGKVWVPTNSEYVPHPFVVQGLLIKQKRK